VVKGLSPTLSSLSSIKSFDKEKYYPNFFDSVRNSNENFKFAQVMRENKHEMKSE
jgi:hypothetical protein